MLMMSGVSCRLHCLIRVEVLGATLPWNRHNMTQESVSSSQNLPVQCFLGSAWPYDTIACGEMQATTVSRCKSSP